MFIHLPWREDERFRIHLKNRGRCLRLLRHLAGKRWKELSAVLGGVIVLVLLIVASDLASLLLARAERRQHEIAIRLALGASRMQIIRALVVEGLLLSGFGAAAGSCLPDGR